MIRKLVSYLDEKVDAEEHREVAGGVFQLGGNHGRYQDMDYSSIDLDLLAQCRELVDAIAPADIPGWAGGRRPLDEMQTMQQAVRGVWLFTYCQQAARQVASPLAIRSRHVVS